MLGSANVANEHLPGSMAIECSRELNADEHLPGSMYSLDLQE